MVPVGPSPVPADCGPNCARLSVGGVDRQRVAHVEGAPREGRNEVFPGRVCRAPWGRRDSLVTTGDRAGWLHGFAAAHTPVPPMQIQSEPAPPAAWWPVASTGCQPSGDLPGCPGGGPCGGKVAPPAQTPVPRGLCSTLFLLPLSGTRPPHAQGSLCLLPPDCSVPTPAWTLCPSIGPQPTWPSGSSSRFTRPIRPP